MADKSNTQQNKSQHLAEFLKLSANDVREYMKLWNSQQINLKIPKESSSWGYDNWISFLKDKPADVIKGLQANGSSFLSVEGYIAVRVLSDVITNPHRINKIHSTSLSMRNGEDEKSLLDKAREGDTLGVLSTQLERLIVESEKASPKDLPNYTRAISEMMEQINDLKRRQAPSTDTLLGRMLDENIQAKRTRGNGSSHKKFKSRVVTIDDVEN